MKVDQNLICSFQIIKSDVKIKGNKSLKMTKYATWNGKREIFYFANLQYLMGMFFFEFLNSIIW